MCWRVVKGLKCGFSQVPGVVRQQRTGLGVQQSLYLPEDAFPPDVQNPGHAAHGRHVHAVG